MAFRWTPYKKHRLITSWEWEARPVLCRVRMQWLVPRPILIGRSLVIFFVKVLVANSIKLKKSKLFFSARSTWLGLVNRRHGSMPIANTTVPKSARISAISLSGSRRKTRKEFWFTPLVYWKSTAPQEHELLVRIQYGVGLVERFKSTLGGTRSILSENPCGRLCRLKSQLPRR